MSCSVPGDLVIYLHDCQWRASRLAIILETCDANADVLGFIFSKGGRITRFVNGGALWSAER